MITPDTTEIFPSCPTFGFRASPRYRVKIIPREGGYERRNRKWSRPLHLYTAVPMGQRPAEDIQNVLAFWHAMGGRSTGFRFKDYADFKSVQVQQTVSAIDQPLVLSDETGGGYQLTKQYTAGSVTQVREIYKPKGDTIRIANEVGAEQAADRWTVDEATGILIPGGTFAGVPTSWGGEFYVYVRFDSDLDVEITQHMIQAAEFMLAEIRPNP